MEVLQQYGQNTDDMSITICNTTLEILSEYADWIDVSFMINPVTLTTLFALLEYDQYAENVLLCFEELINKGMPPGNQNPSDSYTRSEYPLNPISNDSFIYSRRYSQSSSE